MKTYSTATAAKRLAGIGISASTVRNYASDARIAPLLCDAARPGPGKARRFTDTDLQVIATIYRQVKQGSTIDDATASVRDVGLLEPPVSSYRQAEDADGQPQEPEVDTIPPTTEQAALVLAGFYERMLQHESGLQAEITRLTAENARLQAELDAARRPWWRRITGQ